MKTHPRQALTFRQRQADSGFTLPELMVSAMLFLVGLVAVAQLVPVSVNMYTVNRADSSALTYAQRELVQFLEQPLTTNAFLDADSNACVLGDPTLPNTVVGSPLAPNSVVIDYTAGTVPGYSFIYHDPNDPSGTSYDIRWAVITNSQGGAPISKRFIMGAWRRGGNGFALPVTIDAWVQK